ncbi:hypothetical protein IJ21_17750 [Paenibacillus sp. 32O-W]|uniref:hypothetical protein n=1 Tax=Paenibacillus sp. 32O-W TaxID=1695218 RepID=UPI000721109E|nr:hypothetical protein [Paenibacillus sp. 32O-W]ALS27176.1 hypothetical protein IJ21_17750 [Paenibacillus sp. 32O-W]
MSREKRITTRQAVKLVQDAYDRYEALAKQALREEFGFGPARLARFEERFSELAAQEAMRIETRLRRGSN